LVASLFLSAFATSEGEKQFIGTFRAMMQTKWGGAVRKMGLPENAGRRFAGLLRALAWFRPGLRVGVGVSGGADSVALLTLLTKMRAELGVVVSAVHFNNKLRGKASDADEKFVASLAEKSGVTLHVGRADVLERPKAKKQAWKIRCARYGFFRCR
jgi:tRNA(Ile)-lysidine synthase TilS/MesJ